MDFLTLSWVDYTLFALMFILSCGVGIYFGCFRKQQTTSDYLLGGKNMNIFPVSMSLAASTLSGVTILGIPTEIYKFGTQYSMMVVSLVIVGVVNIYIYLPVFHKLQLTSAFEYFQLRFDTKVKLMASFLYALSCLLTIPVFIYAPALAFNQVTGFNLYLIASVMCLICVFYTTIGGFKAVVWTDTIQFCVTLCTLIGIMILGTNSLGGPGTIWQRSKLGDRLHFFNMDPDPTTRTTFWTIFLGNAFLWGAVFAADPAAIQRSISVPTLQDAKKCTIIYVIVSVFTKLVSCSFGLIMYAKYYDCDPLSAGFIKRADQILPYYVMEEATAIPGLSGLFVAVLFSTSLSTLSTFLNTLSGILYTDFLTPFLPANTSEMKANTIIKILTVVLGFISLGLVFVVERLGSVLEMLMTLRGMTAGPILALFTMGLIFPFANYKGSLCGSAVSLLITCFVLVKNQMLRWDGTIKDISKPFSTFGCNTTTAAIASVFNYTLQIESSNESPSEESFWLYRISFIYYFLMSTVLTLIVGLPISWITSNLKDKPLNPNYLSPYVHRFLITSTSIDRELQELEGNKNSTELEKTVKDKLLA